MFLESARSAGSQPPGLPISTMLAASGSVVNYGTTKFEDAVPAVDAVLDNVGGATQLRSYHVKAGRVLLSVTSTTTQPAGFRATLFLVNVTTTLMNRLGSLLDSRKLTAELGSVLPLEEARRAHEMLAGAPRKRGRIVVITGGIHLLEPASPVGLPTHEAYRCAQQKS